MLLPRKFNQGFTVQWAYEGKEGRDFTDTELQQIIPFDPLCVERQKLTKELHEKIINPLVVLYSKHLILKEVLISSKEPCDRLLYNLIEDAARQNITDFYDLMGKFIEIVKRYKNNYSPLFYKDSQKKLLMTLKQGKPIELVNKYCMLDNLIDNKRNALFFCSDKKGSLQSDNWDRLICELRAIRNIIKTYRDKVASHADEELTTTLSWKKATEAIEFFINYTSDIHTVLSFRVDTNMRSNDLDRDRLQTVKALRSILFK
jgi:hypothetical protein